MQTRSYLCVSAGCIFCYIWNIPLMGQSRSLLSTALCKPPFMCSSLNILPIPSMSQVDPEQIFLHQSQPWAVAGGAACRQMHQHWDWHWHPICSSWLPLSLVEVGTGSHFRLLQSLHCPDWWPQSSMISVTSFCPMKNRLWRVDRWEEQDS